MDAIKLLKQDHEAVKKILKQLEDSSEEAVKTRERLFTKLEHDFRVHEEMEEKVFYPAMKSHEKLKDIVMEGYEEHHVADVVLREMEKVDFSQEKWTAKLAVLKENIEHHIEEEEGEMFKKAQQEFEKEELERLGEQMMKIKRAGEEKQEDAA